MWSEEETLYLFIGVELYGKGKWGKILDKFQDKFIRRSSWALWNKYNYLSLEDNALYKMMARNAIVHNPQVRLICESIGGDRCIICNKKCRNERVFRVHFKRKHPTFQN